jgi:Predicted nucleotidyltransferases
MLILQNVREGSDKITMDSDKINILDKLKSKESIDIFKQNKINTAIVFGSILTEDFEEYSDVDIAILSKNQITTEAIMLMEESFKKLLNRDVDIVDLKSENTQLNMKVSIYDNGEIIYDDDDCKLYNLDYMEVERVYKENETFRFFRERDLIFDE